LLRSSSSNIFFILRLKSSMSFSSAMPYLDFSGSFFGSRGMYASSCMALYFGWMTISSLMTLLLAGLRRKRSATIKVKKPRMRRVFRTGDSRFPTTLPVMSVKPLKSPGLPRISTPSKVCPVNGMLIVAFPGSKRVLRLIIVTSPSLRLRFLPLGIVALLMFKYSLKRILPVLVMLSSWPLSVRVRCLCS